MSAQPQTSAERDEALLIERILAGETALFHGLIRPYELAVYVVAYSVLRDAAEAEEVSQKTLLKALTQLRQLRAGDRFQGWVLQIAFNEARSRRATDPERNPGP